MVWLLDPTVVPPWYVLVHFDRDALEPIKIGPLNLKDAPKLGWFTDTGSSWKKLAPPSPPDVIGTMKGTLVSPRVRDIIETLEPARHHFAPCTIREDKNRPKTEMPYLFLKVTESIDCIDFDHSAVSWNTNRDGRRFNINLLCFGGHDFGGTLKESYDRVCLKSAPIEGHHLWTNAGGPGGYFVSDELKNKLDQAGIVGFDAWKCSTDQEVA